MKLKYKRALAVGGAALLIPGAMTASLFDGLVWDIPQELNSARQLLQEVQMVQQMVQQVQMMQYNIRAFPSHIKAGFQGFMQPFYRPATGNLFGETQGWADMMNNSRHTYSGVRQGWESAGVSLRPSSLFRNNLVNSNGLNSLANVEIADAAGVNAVQTVNTLRDQQPVNQAAIERLQASCLQTANDTEAMQSNCASATGILNAQAAQTTNALLSSVVDLNAAQTKEMRDREARRVNFESRTLEYQATESTGVSLSQRGWRNFRFQF
jgi:hypothetical protein